MTAKIISIKNNPLLIYVIVGAILCSAVFYIYCVNASVHNVVAREDIENQISKLRNHVSELEYQYMNKEATLTIDTANSYGLSEPRDKVFISKEGVDSGKALSINKP